jgi:osmoprotectant transport system ATP-binding protein
MASLSFQHVSKIFPGSAYSAVNDCTFTVDSGSFVVLLGPSGCGKTSLLKMGGGLLEPTEGNVLLDGRDIREMDVTTLRRRIGYVIQQVGLFPHLTVAGNIAVVPELLGWDKARIEARIDELLALVQLRPDYYRGRYPAQLSGGQQQRVGLARALAADPQLLLMDEPFGAIDAIARANLQEEMLRLKNAIHKTVLFVTHDVEEALRLADRIVVMRAGRIVQNDTPFKILTEPANEFVSELVGADDMVRQLSLVQVASIMSPLPKNFAVDGKPVIQAKDDLRSALSKLLQTGASSLAVVEGHVPVGILSLEQIRASAKQ